MIAGIPLVPIILAVVANMIVGMIWYSPFLFGPMWMKEIGMKEDEMKKGANKAMIFSVIAELITAIILYLVLKELGVATIDRAIEVAFTLWLGFIATTCALPVIYESKSSKVAVLQGSYKLVAMIAMAVVMVSWK